MKRYVAASLFAFALSAAFCRLLLPLLKKLKAGQNVLSYVKEHAAKSGTPTMGGLSFIFAALIAVAVFSRGKSSSAIVSCTLFLAFACVGFLDDAAKIKKKENLGLTPWQKIVFQSVCSVLAGVYCYRGGATKFVLPFSSRTAEFGFFTVPLVAFVFLSLVNAVNLTDGLDGLAGGASAAYFFSFGALILLQIRRGNAVSSAEPLALVCFCAAAAICGFLLFNVSPASVFMGDTGSLALGGLASCVAAFSGNVFFVPVVGAVFVASVISVVVQVIYYKATRGKRVFLMSPVHHHFQMKGFSESKISYCYALITAILGVVSAAFS